MTERPLRLRRSELATPGSSEKMLAKAAGSDADLVFCDLEDSVAPAQKAEARATVVTALNELDWGGRTRAVRINPVGSRFAHRDLVEVVAGAGRCLDVVIVPKVTAPRDVWFVETMLAGLEGELGLTRHIGIEVLIEEAAALANVEAIAAASPRLEALILGVGDLAASLGLPIGDVGGAGSTYPGDVWHHARARMVTAARANGLDPIDGPYADFADEEGYRREASWGASLGCVGKWAIHPAQAPIANQVFSPSDEAVALARKVVDAVAAAEAEGSGAARLGGTLIDAASARIFQGVLDRAELVAGRKY